MRILIVSLPRTGSQSLLEQYGKDYNLKTYGEPFHSWLNNIKHYNIRNNLARQRYNLVRQDNSCVKCIINQTLFNMDPVEFYTEFSSIYDKVILLSRKNLVECAESFSYLLWNLPKGLESNQPYVYEKTPNYESTYKTICKLDKWLKQLSDKIKIPISYYEDLYDINSPERLRHLNKKLL